MRASDIVKGDKMNIGTNSRSTRMGFTLIELLVVIGIIGILAALLFPVLARGKKAATRIQCANNLKQLALAINMYAEDHGDQLPGPVWQGLYPVYDNTSTLFMPYYIAKYLSLPAPSGTVVGVPSAVCPASARITHATLDGTLTTVLRQPISYIETITVTNVQDDVVSRPFGYPYEHLPNSNGFTNEPPKRLKEIRNPSSSWALEDTDQQNAVSLAQYYNYIPPTLAHDSVRNELFFDWHVEGVKP